MVSPQEKAQCVTCFIETKSDFQIQRRHWTKYGKDPPSSSSIRRWHKKFKETRSVLDAVRNSSSSKISSSSEIRCYMISANSFRFGCHLAEISVTFAFCKHTIVTFCIKPSALLEVVIPIFWQQYRWTSLEND